jgi:hypothetical protein
MFTTVKPLSPRSRPTSASSFKLEMPAYRGSVTGKSFPMSPSREAPVQGIHDGVDQYVGIRVAQSPLS